MFTDQVKLFLQAGKGGNGSVAWRREKFIPKGGPSGGDGGQGGSILFKVSHDILSLEDFRHKRIFKAENGGQGGSSNKKGKDGRNLVINIPPGTIMKDVHTGEIIFDFTKPGEELILCSGGKGGKGNTHFKTSIIQAPNYCTPGIEGKAKTVELELKLIADVGLVGMPNAGKSTLMTKLTKNPVKIGAYPFTTLLPNLGKHTFDDYTSIMIADIPGLIDRAHENKGLGSAFLRHIERTRMLIFVIDIAAFEGHDPYDDFVLLRKELHAYNPALLDKPFFTLLNKIDALEDNTLLDNFKSKYSFPKETLLEISAMKNIGLQNVVQALSLLRMAIA